MIRDALSNIGGVGVYGVISIALFFVSFLGLVIWAFRLKQPWLKTMGRLPLEPDDAHDREASDSPKPKYRHE